MKEDREQFEQEKEAFKREKEELCLMKQELSEETAKIQQEKAYNSLQQKIIEDAYEGLRNSLRLINQKEINEQKYLYLNECEKIQYDFNQIISSNQKNEKIEDVKDNQSNQESENENIEQIEKDKNQANGKDNENNDQNIITNMPKGDLDNELVKRKVISDIDAISNFMKAETKEIKKESIGQAENQYNLNLNFNLNLNENQLNKNENGEIIQNVNDHNDNYSDNEEFQDAEEIPDNFRNIEPNEYNVQSQHEKQEENPNKEKKRNIKIENHNELIKDSNNSKAIKNKKANEAKRRNKVIKPINNVNNKIVNINSKGNESKESNKTDKSQSNKQNKNKEEKFVKPNLNASLERTKIGSKNLDNFSVENSNLKNMKNNNSKERVDFNQLSSEIKSTNEEIKKISDLKQINEEEKVILIDKEIVDDNSIEFAPNPDFLLAINENISKNNEKAFDNDAEINERDKPKEDKIHPTLPIENLNLNEESKKEIIEIARQKQKEYLEDSSDEDSDPIEYRDNKIFDEKRRAKYGIMRIS